MVKHIILWTLKDEYTEAQKAEIRAGIKEGLELSLIHISEPTRP